MLENRRPAVCFQHQHHVERMPSRHLRVFNNAGLDCGHHGSSLSLTVCRVRVGFEHQHATAVPSAQTLRRPETSTSKLATRRVGPGAGPVRSRPVGEPCRRIQRVPRRGVTRRMIRAVRYQAPGLP